MGFKGSGARFEMSRDGYCILLAFQKSRWSTRKSVAFDLNLSVIHPDTLERFIEANRQARELGKSIEGYGYVNRLRHLLLRKDFCWTVSPNGPNEVVADDVIQSLRGIFLPVIEEEIRRPLPSPTPLAKRADNSHRKGEEYFLRTLRGSRSEGESN